MWISLPSAAPVRASRRGVRAPASSLLLPVTRRARLLAACAVVPACVATVAGAQTVPQASAAQEPTLAAVVVTATRFSQPGASLPFGVTVIEPAQIRASGARTVNEAIARLAGVPARLDLSGGRNAALDLRGFGATADSNQVVILDGIRLSEQDLTNARLASVPLDRVARIEIIRGSAAVLYGEGATGGAIVVTTTPVQAGPTGASGQVSATVGSFNTRELQTSAAVTTAAGSGLLTLDGAAERRLSDNHRDNFRSSERNTFASLRWQSADVSVGLRAGVERLDSGLPGDLTAAQFAANPRQAKSLTDLARLDTRTASVFARGRAGEWELGLDWGVRDKDYDSVNGGRFVYNVSSSSLGLQARRSFDLGWALNELQLGLERQVWERDGIVTATDARSRSRALYVRDELTLQQGTRLSAGWRGERMRKATLGAGGVPLEGNEQALEMGVSHPLSPSTTVYARMGRSFRLANADEFSFTDPARNLQPQVSRDLEMGARWQQASQRLELRAYQSRLTDEIGYDPAATNAFGPTGANINFDPTQRYGLELEGQMPMSSSWTLVGSAAVRRATFRDGRYAGRDVPLVPRATVSASVQWQPGEADRVNLGLQWVGSQFPTFDNTCRIPAYTLLNAGYTRSVGALEWSVSVDNLTDRRYFTQAFACAGSQATSVYPEAGRQVRLSARWTF